MQGSTGPPLAWRQGRWRVVAGSGTVVDNAYIGPFTSIYFDCVVRNAEIENSIVLEGTRIHDIAGKIDGSLIGKECVVRCSRSRPRAHRLMLGDHSRVSLA